MAYIGQSLTEGTRRAYTFVATSGQTTFNAVYGVGAVDVYQNGILLQPSDYNSSSGSSVVLGVGAAVNDEITIIAHNTFSVADTVSSSQGGTFAGAVTASNGLTVDDDGATPLTVDRATNDGTIIDAQRDGTSVGSIKTDSGKLVVNSQGSNLVFAVGGTSKVNMDGTQFYPQTDGGLNLSHPSVRWQDLYLSGGAYLGGTGAANKLDDYEEGTYTPTYTNGSVSYSAQYGNYVKIGTFCRVWFDFTISSASGQSGTPTITLPFNAKSGDHDMGAFTPWSISDNYTGGRTPTQWISVNTSYMMMYTWTGDSAVGHAPWSLNTTGRASGSVSYTTA